MATSYSKMTLAELEREKAKIEKAIEAKQGPEKDNLIKKITALASNSGFDIGELFDGSDAAPRAARGKKRASKVRGKRTSSAKGTKVPPKYRNPDDPTQTWAGRGRQPRWYADKVAAGVDPESMAA